MTVREIERMYSKYYCDTHPCIFLNSGWVCTYWGTPIEIMKTRGQICPMNSCIHKKAVNLMKHECNDETEEE